MSRTARTTACRSSTATASTRRSGTTCTGRARCYLAPGKCPVCYVGEIGPDYGFNRGAPNLGPRVSVLDHKGNSWRGSAEPLAGTRPGQFLSPHGLAADSRGDLYVGEVAVTAWPSLFPGEPVPKPLRSLQKFTKLGKTAMIEREVVVTTKYGNMPSFTACPDTGGPFPGIIMYLDAPGMREEIRNLARRVAKRATSACCPTCITGSAHPASTSRAATTRCPW